MAHLYFKVASDYKEVIRLREECRKLEDQLRKMDQTSSASSIRQLEKRLSEVRSRMTELVSEASRAGAALENNLDKSMQNAARSTERMSFSMGKLLGVIGGAAALKELGANIVKVTGDFESMETSISVLLGEKKDKLEDLMKEIREYALISPLNTKDMADALKMMMGFGLEAEDSIKYLKALGDISMGDTVKFNSLTLAFSQMSAAGKLMGQDLNQMINAGFNPLSIIAEKTGKSVGDLKEQMSKGAISAQMVQQAFIDATSEGGKFFGMAAEGAKTINGQISMVGEAIDNMFIDMGKSSKGLIVTSLSGVTKLIENYETVGKVLTGLVATYGVYRTALALATAAESKHTLAEIALTNVRIAARKAQMALNAAMLTNPYVAVATSIAALAAAAWAMSKNLSAAERAQKRLNDAQKKFTDNEKERRQNIDSLIQTIQDETETDLAKVRAYEELQRLSPAITEAYGREELAVLDLAKANKILNQERDTNMYDSLTRSIDEAEIRLRKLREENGKTMFVDLQTGREVYKDNSKKIQEEEEFLKMQKKALDDFKNKYMKADNEKKPENYQKALADAKSDWEKAKKGYEALKKDQDATVEMLNEAKAKLQGAESKYRNLGGDTSEKKTPKPKKKEYSLTVEDDDVTLISPEDIEKDIAMHRRMMNEYLKDYGSYLQKRQAITELYQEKIRNAGTEGEKLSIGEEMKRALSNLDIEANKSVSSIEKLFGDLREKTAIELRGIAEDAEEAFEFLQAGEWNENKGLKFGISRESYDIMSNSPEELERIRRGIEDVRNEADHTDTSFRKMANGLDKVLKAGDNTRKLKEGLGLIEEGIGEVTNSVGFLSGAFSDLGTVFGSNFLSGIGEGLDVAMNTMNSAMDGAKAGAMFGPIGSAAGAALGVVSSLGTAIARIHDRKNERRIQRLQDQVDALDRSYEKLDRSIRKAYSNDAKNLIEDQNKLLEQQKVLIQQQINEENKKKKKDKDRIKDWEDQINDINNLIEDNKEKAIDALFGEDIQSAISDFSSAMADAWTSGSDHAKSARDVVKSMMQNMVVESIKAAISASDAMEKIRLKLQEFFSDKVLSDWEQNYIYDMAENLQKDIDRQFGWAEGLFEDKKNSGQQSATSRGFEAMNQEQGEELSGRFTSVSESQMRVEAATMEQTLAITDIKGSLGDMNGSVVAIQNIADDTRDIIANSYLELQQIRENTGAIIKPIIQMQKDIEEVKLNTDKL